MTPYLSHCLQNTRKGTRMVDELNKQGIVPGIKVDKVRLEL